MVLAPLILAFALQEAAPAAEQSRSVSVVVADEKGQPIEGLSAEEVAVMENGVARAVTSLEPDRRPLTLALIVDSSVAFATLFRLNLVPAVAEFLRQLPEGTKFSVWTTGDRPVRVTDFSADAAAAVRALERVAPQGGNTVFDAIVEASRDLGRREAERTAVVVVSGKGVGFTNYDRRQVVDDALESGATFLTVGVDEGRAPFASSPPEGEVAVGDYEYVLSELAARSGGVRETTLSAMGIARALSTTAAALRGRYRLRYLGGGGKGDDLKVQVARPGAKAQVVPPRP